MFPASGNPSICQVVHGLPVGGAEVLVNRIIRALRHRFRFTVACLDEVGQLGEMLAQDGIPIVPLNRRPGFDWSCIRRLNHLFLEEDVQVVHAHQYTPFAYALATGLVGRRPPIVFTEHGRFYPDICSRKRKWFNRLMIRRRDRFTAVGQSVRQALINNEGLPPQRLEIVYNGVDMTSWEAKAGDRADARAELAATDDEFLVVQVARLDPIKDHITAIRAIGLATRQNPRIRLLLVGDGPLRAALEQEIRAIGIDDRVRLLGLRQDVRRLLTASDAFLLTSVSEGIPVTVLEAMAAGVPVVATSVGGLPELVANEISGLLVPAGDAPQLAASLLRLAASPALAAALAFRARQRAHSDFSEAQMLSSYERIYRDLLTARAETAEPVVNGRSGRPTDRVYEANESGHHG